MTLITRLSASRRAAMPQASHAIPASPLSISRCRPQKYWLLLIANSLSIAFLREIILDAFRKATATDEISI